MDLDSTLKLRRVNTEYPIVISIIELKDQFALIQIQYKSENLRGKNRKRILHLRCPFFMQIISVLIVIFL